MLRRAQHERKFLCSFNPVSARPERVEGLLKNFSAACWSSRVQVNVNRSRRSNINYLNILKGEAKAGLRPLSSKRGMWEEAASIMVERRPKPWWQARVSPILPGGQANMACIGPVKVNLGSGAGAQTEGRRAFSKWRGADFRSYGEFGCYSSRGEFHQCEDCES
jgi:hypothetical protein